MGVLQNDLNYGWGVQWGWAHSPD